MSAGILLACHIQGFEEEINFLNIYGPYKSKELFWDRIVAKGTLNLPNLVIAGDLNFTWSAAEVWGAGRPIHPLESYFISLFAEAGL